MDDESAGPQYFLLSTISFNLSKTKYVNHLGNIWFVACMIGIWTRPPPPQISYGKQLEIPFEIIVGKGSRKAKYSEVLFLVL